MAIVEKAVIHENYATGGKYLVVLGREYPGAPRSLLRPDGTWKPMHEAHAQGAAVDDDAWWNLPEGALEAIVMAAGDTAPQPATEHHLNDAIEVRDRLFELVERLTTTRRRT